MSKAKQPLAAEVSTRPVGSSKTALARTHGAHSQEQRKEELCVCLCVCVAGGTQLAIDLGNRHHLVGQQRRAGGWVLPPLAALFTSGNATHQ